jgi:hypothetical protein
MSRAPFVFQEVEIWTGVDLMETLSLISEQSEADEFMVAYSELFEDDENAIQSVRYYVQVIAYDPDDDEGEIREEMQRICKMLDVDFPSASEIISPQHTFGNSSYGVKVAA